jgi:hypothetical protein
MKIRIEDNRKISEIQKKFNSQFPYLKLEFFSRPHKNGAPSARVWMKPSDMNIGDCRVTRSDGDLEISPKMTVSDLEQRFKKIFGLNVQVFRKSGRVWLETSVTDSWTLEEQNSQGQTLSEVIMYNTIQKKHTGS